MLNQDRGAAVTPERSKAIKLLQDLAIESGQFLDGMILPGDFKSDGSEKSAGEAKIMFGDIGQESVAIRVPKVHLGQKGPSSWVKEKVSQLLPELLSRLVHLAFGFRYASALLFFINKSNTKILSRCWACILMKE